MKKARTLEAKLALLSRISHRYEIFGVLILFSMHVIQHCASCKPVDVIEMTTFTPMLRLIFSILILIDQYDILKVKHAIAGEVFWFIQRHISTLNNILCKDEGDTEPGELAS